MSSLDLTGYTRLTEERGDEAAAELAVRLARMGQRISVRRGGHGTALFDAVDLAEQRADHPLTTLAVDLTTWKVSSVIGLLASRR